MAIWQYGQEGLNNTVPLTQAIYKKLINIIPKII